MNCRLDKPLWGWGSGHWLGSGKPRLRAGLRRARAGLAVAIGAEVEEGSHLVRVFDDLNLTEAIGETVPATLEGLLFVPRADLGHGSAGA